MREKYGVQDETDLHLHPDTQSSGVSDGASGTDEDAGREASASDSGDGNANADATVNADPEKTPKRVMVFTTVMLLGLLTMCRWGSVDGTFKASTKHWKQLFVMLLNFNGTWLPVCFGWLPDKSLISYQLFVILVLEAFLKHQSEIHQIYGKSKLKLRKVKMDFEINVINAVLNKQWGSIHQMYHGWVFWRIICMHDILRCIT